MKTYTELEIIAQERQKQINDMNIQLEQLEGLQLAFKRLERRIEKREKTIKGLRDSIKHLKDNRGIK